MLISTVIEQNESSRIYGGLMDTALEVSLDAQPSIRTGSGPQDESNAVPVKIDFEALTQINGDVVGWLYAENTPINYPVVQGKNNEYYVDHLIDGTRNRSGTLFLDFENNDRFFDNNSIIYGHNMNNGSMFACLTQYRSQQYFEEHPHLYLLTPRTNYRIDLFSGYTTAYDSEAYQKHFESSTEFNRYILRIYEKSDFINNVQIKEDDKIITLSTCTYQYDDARYVVHGKLVAAG